MSPLISDSRVQVVAVAYILVFAACAVINDLRPAFAFAAACSLVFLGLGIYFFPHMRRAFQTFVPSSTSGAQAFRIVGQQIYIRPYQQTIMWIIKPSNVIEVAVCALLACGTLGVLVWGKASYDPLFRGFGLLKLELLCIAAGAVILRSLLWSLECYLLKRAAIVLAPITSLRGSMSRPELAYEFMDQSGTRFAGYTRTGGRDENVVVVFYDPKNPDKNMAHRSFRFHQILLLSVSALQPAVHESPDRSQGWREE